MNIDKINYLEKFLKSLSKGCDGADLLYQEHDVFSGDQSKTKPKDLSKKTSHSLMVTKVMKDKMIRSSWATNSFDLLKKMTQSISKPLSQYEETCDFNFSEDKRLPPIDSILGADESKKQRQHIESCFSSVEQAYMGWNMHMRFEQHNKQCVYMNTLGISSGYEKLFSTLNYLVYSDKNQVIKRGKFNLGGTADKIIETIDADNNQYFSTQDYGFVKGGKSAVLLSPRVVEVLSAMVVEKCKIHQSWDPKIEKALPEDFCLIENPNDEFHHFSVPFDDEGILTSEKVLCKNRKRINVISDQRSAKKFDQKMSTGNGFRRGIFWSEPLDNVPSIHPSCLKLLPGKRERKDIYKNVNEFILINDVSLPYDRFQDLFSGQAMVTLHGEFFQKGKRISKIFAKNYSRRSLISSYPESYGSLLDPNAEILSEGDYCQTGWFPYIFLPILNWG